MNKYYLFLLLVLLTCCYRVSDRIEPKLCYKIEERYLKSLPSPFPPLADHEKEKEWGREMLIAQVFAQELDLYRAITSFKRAKVFLPADNILRLQEIEYDILLCYYLGQKYQEVITTFEKSSLLQVDKDFTAFHDLLIILYDSYKQTGEEEKAAQLVSALENFYPPTGKKIKLSSYLFDSNLCEIEKLSKKKEYEYLRRPLDDYLKEKKSPSTAQFLNAALPGSGYLYVGQLRSGITALLLNGLFIAASYQFFHKGHITAGIITTSFEMGWYFGGIYGAGEAAKFYNERLYEEKMGAAIKEKGLCPIFMLKFSF